MGKYKAAGIVVPDFLYKYRGLRLGEEEFTKDIFAECRLFFASPSNFNDPFDGGVHFLKRRTTSREWRDFIAGGVDNILGITPPREVLDQLVPKGGRKRLHALQAIEGMVQNDMDARTRIVSLSARRDSILMWSHYSDNHKGFCLEFKTGGSGMFDVALPVRYSRRLPLSDLLSDEREKVVMDRFLTKSVDWEYEEEWRIVRGFDSQPEDFYAFLPEDLAGVIFGCRMPQDDKDKIRMWLQESRCRPRLYQANVKTGEFGLDIVPE